LDRNKERGNEEIGLKERSREVKEAKIEPERKKHKN